MDKCDVYNVVDKCIVLFDVRPLDFLNTLTY